MSINHDKYTLVIVDEYSRTDNGTEFRKFELKSFCDENGISQNFTSPYTPEQNGVVERKNITLIEAARTIMEAIRFINTSIDEIRIDDSSRYPPDEFLHDDDPSRQYLANFDISYYITPHGRSLTELTKTIISYPGPRDRWSRDQHIELMNIIGEPTECILTRSMDAKLIVALAGECLFADFLPKIEPKKVSDALKHPGNKARPVAQGFSQEEEIDYDETFAPAARMEAIRFFLAFATYMNFKVFQLDVKSAFLNGKLKEEVYVKQPPGFESSEFPDYVFENSAVLTEVSTASVKFSSTFKRKYC
ncbi:retrovirus-related pol polyprotein from transposon TNT 1-94 [Tanacetum coccineum]